MLILHEWQYNGKIDYTTLVVQFLYDTYTNTICMHRRNDFQKKVLCLLLAHYGRYDIFLIAPYIFILSL